MLLQDTDWAEYPALSMSAIWNDVVVFFQENRDATFCAIVDVDHYPIGIISLQQYQQMVGSPFGHALNHRKTALELMQEEFVCAVFDQRAEEVFAGIVDTAQLLNSGLVLTDRSGRYLGGLNARAVFVCLNQIHSNMLASLQAQIAEREEIERQVRNLADTDSLTSILNRRAFVREVSDLIGAEKKFVCAFVDLDRFKPLNDRYGHAVGDQVLITIAKRLQSNPNCHLAARLGGDEFAFTVMCDSTFSARDLIEEIHDHITGAINTDFGDVSVGASIGAAAFPTDAHDQMKLLHAADKAMMRCKSNGGGACFFDRAKDNFGLDAEALEFAISEAVRKDLFKPAIQPVVDLKTRRVIGHEVLARWPESGFSVDPSPVQFIPVIERIGMMDRFFVSLFRQAIPVLQTGDGFLAFNVSPSQLSSPRFSNLLVSELKDLGIPGERIELEVTEHVLFRNIDRAREALNQLCEQGVSLSLDDFGTGYSALSLLEELPFSKVKLDKSLLGKGDSEIEIPKVLSASLQMCKELGLTTCTEGIEEKHQVELLTAHGCDQGQGFYFGRPELCAADYTNFSSYGYSPARAS